MPPHFLFSFSSEPFSAYVNHCNLRGGPKIQVSDNILFYLHLHLFIFFLSPSLFSFLSFPKVSLSSRKDCDNHRHERCWHLQNWPNSPNHCSLPFLTMSIFLMHYLWQLVVTDPPCTTNQLRNTQDAANQGSTCFSPSGNTCEVSQLSDCNFYGSVK